MCHQINNSLNVPEFNEDSFKYIKNNILNDYKNIYENKNVPLTSQQARQIIESSADFVRRYGPDGNDIIDNFKTYVATSGLEPQEAIKSWLSVEKPSLKTNEN